MIEAYRPIIVAEVCFPFEAAEWLAFGRLPEEFVTEFKVAPFTREYREVRKEVRALCSTEYPVGDDFYRPDELEAVGFGADYQRYVEIASCDEPVYLHELFHGTFTDQKLGKRGLLEFAPPTPAAYENALLMERVSEAMAPLEERARLMVLLALMDGRLTAQGFAVPEGWAADEDGVWVRDNGKDGDLEELYSQAVARPIPQSAWRNTLDVWDIGTGIANLPGFIGAWISTEQLLEIFPQPNRQIQEFSGQRVGETIISSSERKGRGVSTPVKRGRHKKAGGVVEKAVKNEFLRRLRAGLLPEKSESVVYECMSWAKETLEESISRTTAQRYLAAVFEEAANARK